MNTEPAPFQRIAADLRGRIAAGELRPGDRIPSARTLTRQWSVAIATASRALAALRAEGLTSVVPGVGTVVSAPVASPARRSRRLPDTPTAHDPQTADVRGGVVACAIAIADRDGLAEVSMRRVATELGVATMSLYRMLGGKDELLVQMIDAALGEQPLPDNVNGDWRIQLEAVADALWRVFRRHPWLATAMSITRPQLAPSTIILANRVLGILETTGLHSQERLYAHVSLFTFVRGVASALEPEALARQETGLTSDEWMASQQDGYATAIDPDSPLARLTAGDLDMDLDELFEFGLTRLLDGLAALAGRA